MILLIVYNFRIITYRQHKVNVCRAFWKMSVVHLEKKSWNSYNKRTQNNCVEGGKNVNE